MNERIEWQTLTEDERNALIHDKVFGLASMPCTDGQLDPYMGMYWGCTCGWTSDTPIGEASTEHNIPLPAYSTSMDAAWQVVKAVCTSSKRDDFMGNLSTHSDEYGCMSFMPDEFAALTPEKLCIAALKALGIDTKEMTT